MLTEFSDDLAGLARAFETMQETIRPHQEALTAIANEANNRARERVEAINAETASFYERAGALWEEIAAALGERASSAREIAWASPAKADEGNSLFDSSRGYVAQNDRYKEHLGKPTRRRGE